jgi:hypothetical protein
MLLPRHVYWGVSLPFCFFNAEALEIRRGRDASHKKHGTGMGESMWAQFCADIESSAEREISATQPLQKSYKNKKNTTADVRGL